jgi:hypothetical protein
MKKVWIEKTTLFMSQPIICYQVRFRKIIFLELIIIGQKLLIRPEPD